MAFGPQVPAYYTSLLAQLKAEQVNKPLFYCCADLTRTIDEYTSKDLQGIFEWLVASIFGADGEPGWNLLYIKNKESPTDYAAVNDFLSPCGAMMRLVYKLQVDDAKFSYQVSKLPAPARGALQEGLLPTESPLYVNKLVGGGLVLSLSLNAFEYYLFSFANYLVLPKTSLSPQYAAGPNNLYTALVEDYLKYFLPTMGNAPASPTHTLTKAPSPPNHRPVSCLQSPYSSPLSALLKRPIQHQSPVTPDPAAHQIWHSETLLQVFVELWLHHYSPEVFQKMQSPQARMEVMQWRLCAQGVPLGSPLPPAYCGLLLQEEQFVPTEEHVRVVRLLVKHLHYFSSSARDPPPASPSSPYHSQPTSPLDNFKRVVIPRFVQKKLYVFLQHCFSHWPLDYSFRVVLETWLSYIQPWRYTEWPNGGGESDDPTVPDKWAVFVQENLLFYTRLFQVFVGRTLRSDLSSARHTLMAYRAAKVYAQCNLCALIMKGEQLLQEPEHISPQRQQQSPAARGSSPAPAPPSSLRWGGGGAHPPRQALPGDGAARVRLHVCALEGQERTYTPLFGSEGRTAVLQLVQALQQAQRQAAAAMTAPYRAGEVISSGGGGSNGPSGGRSFLSMLGLTWDLGYGSASANGDDYEAVDTRKLGEHLQKSIEFFSQTFRINAALVVPRHSWMGPGAPDFGTRRASGLCAGEGWSDAHTARPLPADEWATSLQHPIFGRPRTAAYQKLRKPHARSVAVSSDIRSQPPVQQSDAGAVQAARFPGPPLAILPLSAKGRVHAKALINREQLFFLLLIPGASDNGGSGSAYTPPELALPGKLQERAGPAAVVHAGPRAPVARPPGVHAAAALGGVGVRCHQDAAQGAVAH
ncbi:sphingomyelin phosphodiesterase 4 isoform X2 [Lethenteron reissneri]|uniref:sphingomyelin phosphodiesterase 4 isoform X2 n=1 Tax=Lethenteron reissneri TaxID=7753 RepID=UPI002AB75036|nr:sphingomyelin phosphodiesterase 4 isoform X2 [Lethenteron reissneri]